MKRKEIDIAIVTMAIAPYVIGGMEIAMTKFSRALALKGVKVAIITSKTPQSKYLKSDIPHFFVNRNIKGLKKLQFALGALWVLIRFVKAKVVIVVPIHPINFMCLILKKLGVLTINWARGVDIYGLRKSRFAKWMIESTNVTFALSQAIKDRMKAFTSRKMYVVPNGVDPICVRYLKDSQKSKFDSTVIRLCYIGRLIPWKRPDVILRALALLGNSRSEFHLDIIGGGILEKRLKELCKRLSIENIVTIHGKIKHNLVLKILNKSDIFIYPTERGQGLGNAVLEAMCIGLPVIGFSVGYLTELIGADRHGWLLGKAQNREDAAQKLATKLLEISQSYNEIKRKGQRASSFVRTNYTWERVADKVLTIIENYR